MLQLGHKNLKVWKLSLLLVIEIRTITNHFPKDELYVLTSQMRRAALSVINNIAEGASRKSAAERKRFYEISRSSLVELDTDLIVASALKYLDDSRKQKADELVQEIFKLLSAMIKNTAGNAYKNDLMPIACSLLQKG